MLPEALEFMKKAVKNEPGDPVLREHFGDIYLKLSKKDKAREQWLKSLELDPANQKLRERFRETGFGDPDVLLKDVKPRKKEKK
jgi:predicted negative regulator of RcsB-dependent stress response